MLTVAQAALRACVSESLVYAWCSEGTLPHTRVGRKGKRGNIRITIEDLDGVMAAFKVSSVQTSSSSPISPSCGGDA
jgi:excisionase family DNA binding protein